MAADKKAEPESKDLPRVTVPALRVNQWLDYWNVADFDQPHRRRPKKYFHMFKMSGLQLRALCDIHRREVGEPETRAEETGIQRRHNDKRSQVIAEYVRHGYPWSDLPPNERKKEQAHALMKPGWLPTAVVVNILTTADSRRQGSKVHKDDLLEIKQDGEIDHIVLPKDFKDATWRPKHLAPVEVIDGQHRLWAFDHLKPGEDFEMPVVAYHGLDLGWQAYLFWSINIKPTRINKSLAFDLYPLLRSEDWLERSGDLKVYREARAQELVQALWAQSESPWHRRINLLGETGLELKMSTQASWIRGLTSSLLRAPKPDAPEKGGLYTASLDHGMPMEWSGAQEAAFLIHAGNQLRDAVTATKAEWAKELRNEARAEKKESPEEAPFWGRYSLVNTDQGIGGFLLVLNDLATATFEEFEFAKWRGYETSTLATEKEEVTRALGEIAGKPFAKFLQDLADGIANYDWRLSSFPPFTDKEKMEKQALRGSGGYPLVRDGCLKAIIATKNPLAKAAKKVLKEG